MDEPTDGLDPNQKHEMRTLIREMGKTKAIIFSTHILEEVEAACSRAIIIDRGRIVANGTPDELKRRSQHAGAVTLRLLDGDGSLVRQKLNQISAVEKTVVLSDEPFAIRAYAKGNGAPREVARAISALAAVRALENRGIAHGRGTARRSFSQHHAIGNQPGRFRMSEAALETPTDLTESSAASQDVAHGVPSHLDDRETRSR